MSAFVDAITRAREGLAEHAADVPSAVLAARLASLRRDGLAAFEHAARPGVRKILLRPE